MAVPRVECVRCPAARGGNPHLDERNARRRAFKRDAFWQAEFRQPVPEGGLVAARLQPEEIAPERSGLRRSEPKSQGRPGTQHQPVPQEDAQLVRVLLRHQPAGRSSLSARYSQDIDHAGAVIHEPAVTPRRA